MKCKNCKCKLLAKDGEVDGGFFYIECENCGVTLRGRAFDGKISEKHNYILVVVVCPANPDGYVPLDELFV